MASVTEPANLKIFAIAPDGSRTQVFQARNGGPVSAGGSPDGVLANLTIDKQVQVGVGGPVMTTGWSIALEATLDASDGIDESDCVISIPITQSNGVVRFLNSDDLGFTADLPASTPASVPLPIGSGFTIPAGSRFKFGGGPIVISLEDDTA